MLFLLDANVLIRAHGDYYPIDRVPQFWVWLAERGNAKQVKVPFEIYDEIANGNDPLKDWIVQTQIRDALILEEEVDRDVFNLVMDTAYAPDLTDTELVEAGRDPFLVAYARMDSNRCVVTKEVSKPSKQRGRRRIPDACNLLGIPWMTDFNFYGALDFRIT
ncbi:MAG: DUF4411 family protein [Flavobacteriaceae bacterium]